MIIHLDLDCYFVSAERTRTPELNNRPVVVVKSSDMAIFSSQDHSSVMLEGVGAFNGLFQYNQSRGAYKRDGWKQEFIDKSGKIYGIVIAKSYEAKAYGIKTGTPLGQALGMCPDLHVVCSDHLFYQQLSSKLKRFLEERIPVLEQYSIDEFWGELGGWVSEEETRIFIEELQAEILETFNLPMSIGASSSKWIAKLATDFNKPYGITIVPKQTIKEFIAPMNINDFPGIGKVLSARLQSYGIKTLGEVLEAKNLLSSWGRVGKDLYARLSGNDGETVMAHHDRRSIGIGRNFAKIYNRDELIRRIIILSRHLSHTILTLEVSPTTYHFSLKYDGGVKSAHSITIDRPFSEVLFRHLCIDTFKQIDTLSSYGVHYLSMSASNFVTKARPKTFSLLDDEEDKKSCALGESITKLRHKYGMDIIRSGAEKDKTLKD